METKHTPGPWRMNGEIGADESKGIAPFLAFYSIRDANNDYIASTWSDPHEANARLIAAAPELLEALQQIERLSREADGNLVDVRAMLGDIARAVLAKAEGR